ncbi:Mu transposase C-terminal domain-containing protein [Thiomicrorhabdus indica]|uniref:Mu transposase C-terminal domain-containing protein n=1 Tax=Thiomicrorhabdus indica TaxID=2267253 RepID=UPI002AA5F033|nr:Mu transposase C-terminal domain-containing protein [Thiomicrorhabdus indica]
MNKEYFSPQELCEMPGTPDTARGVRLKAERESWKSRKKQKGKGFEYHLSSLPEQTRQYLVMQQKQAEHAALQAQANQHAKQKAETLALELKASQMVRANAREKALAKAAHLEGEDYKRHISKSIMVEMWQNYLQQSSLSKGKATDQFLHMWKHDTLPLADEWRWIRGDYISEDLHKTTLGRWFENPETTISKYGHRKGQTLIDTQPEIRDFVTSMLYTHPQSEAKDIYNGLETEFNGQDLKIPSVGSIRRWLTRYMDENKAVYKAMTNPDAYKNSFMPAQGEITAHALNERWEMDATPTDWELVDGRYSLLAKIDVYSMVPRVLLSPTATSGAQAKLLRDCFMKDGIPQTIKTDNGADYVSLQIRTALRTLDIQQDVSAPFSPWEKGHIERFFKTLLHSMLKMLPGFIGHNVAERSEIESRKQFAERLYKKEVVIEVKMTAEQLQEHINHWIEFVYMHEPHGGLDGKTPFEVLSEWSKPIRKVQNERALDILLAQVGERTVGKEGIRLDNFIYIAPELGPIVGQKVQIRKDPVDVGTIFVFQGGEFICIAEDARFVGIRRQDIAVEAKNLSKKAIKEKKKEIRQLKSKVNTKDIAERILDHKRQQNNVSMLPKRTENYSNDMLEAAMEAVDMRQPSTEVSTTEPSRKLAAVTTIPTVKNPQEVHKRYLRLVNRLQQGDELNQEESRFYRGYHDTPECRTMQEFFEDFGLLNTANE